MPPLGPCQRRAQHEINRILLQEKHRLRRERKDQKRLLKKQHTDRAHRIFNSIVGAGSSRRAFAGTVFIASTIQFSVELAQHDESKPPDPLNPIFWTDGSVHGRGEEQGCMGAGVVWRELNVGEVIKRIDGSWSPSWDWISKPYPLGRNTGEAGDAELFAIGAALGLALETATSSRHGLRSVTVYSDCGDLLESIRDSKFYALGPLLGMKWALEDVLDRAEALAHAGVRVELRWVKGHQKSGSQGNWKAHNAADKGVGLQVQMLRDRKLEEDNVLPEALKGASEDVRDEFFHRKARSWVAYGQAALPKLVRFRGDVAQSGGGGQRY